MTIPTPAHANGTNGHGTNGHSAHTWMARDDVTLNIGGESNLKRLKTISRDFRSEYVGVPSEPHLTTGDTLTIPTDAQLLLSLSTSRGDDVYEEDEATRALEERVARLTGKEAALFAVSGTQTNRASLPQPPPPEFFVIIWTLDDELKGRTGHSDTHETAAT